MNTSRLSAAGRPALTLLFCAAFCSILLASVLWNEGAFLAAWRSKTLRRDLDGDGRAETLVLKARQLTVIRDGREVWATAGRWKVEDFLLGDIDRDGGEELLLLVWRRGSYGPSRPFWVERDETGYSQHIDLYQWREGGFQPMWMSSRLRPGVKEWRFSENGELHIVTAGGEDTVWGWRSWGLERLDGEKKPF